MMTALLQRAARWARTFLPLMLLLFSVLVCNASTLQSAEIDTTSSTVRLSIPTLGELRGRVDAASDVLSFYGVPYASPPVGPLRWKAPVDITASNWPGSPSSSQTDGVYNATSRQSDCVRGTFPPDGTLRGSEDCLYLNIFVPATNVSLPAAGFPVLFYIHGGNFQTTDFDFDGVRPVSVGQAAIYVHVYYRVGLFGFLTHPALSAENQPLLQSGNYGLLDQQSALRFVQRHISAFGGDPSRVTLQGHSAGAWSVCFHLMLPQSAGLFSQAILHSGSCEAQGSLAVLTLVEGETLGLSLADTLGCPLPVLNSNSTAAPYTDQLSCLRSLPAFSAFGAAASTTFTAVVDGVVLPNFPALLLLSGQFAVVPTLIGSTPGELTNFYWLGALPLPPPSHISWPVVSAVVAANVGARVALAPRIASFYTEAVYEAQFNTSDPVTATLDVLNDYVIRCPTHRLAQYSAHTQLYNNATDAHVWSWLWQYLPVHQDPALVAADLQQASHGQDIPFVFDSPNVLSNFTFTAEEHALSAVWMNVIARFVLTGNPNTAIKALDSRFAAAFLHALENSTAPTRAYQLPVWPFHSVDQPDHSTLLLNIQPDAAFAASHTSNTSTAFTTATTYVPVAANSSGFSTLSALSIFGLHCDSLASAALPMDNTAQSRLSACSVVQAAGDVCLSQLDDHNICIDHFNNTFTCFCNADQGYYPGPASLSCAASRVSGRASGDPQLVGLLGQSFQVHGVHGTVYNFVTHSSLQLNARFTFLGGSPTGYDCPAGTECWSHPGNYIGAIGLSQRLGPGQLIHVLITAGGAEQGFSSITVNGSTIASTVGESREWASDDGQDRLTLQLHSRHSLTIVTPLFSFRFENSDRFLNYQLTATVPLDQLHTHGLLGQTWQQTAHDNRHGHSQLPIDGTVDDYAVAGGDLLGSTHKFDRFLGSDE